MIAGDDEGWEASTIWQRIGLRKSYVQCYPALGSAMNSLVERNLEEIAHLCRRYRVRKLAAFGSILRGDFDPARSDVDFLVDFEPVPVEERMRNYLGLREALASLLSRPVDLVEDGAIRNPYILKSVVEQEHVLYAA
jgi:predicted nucleotidyltransferase